MTLTCCKLQVFQFFSNGWVYNTFECRFYQSACLHFWFGRVFKILNIVNILRVWAYFLKKKKFVVSNFVEIGVKWKVATCTVPKTQPLRCNADILENMAKRRKNKQFKNIKMHIGRNGCQKCSTINCLNISQKLRLPWLFKVHRIM